MEQVVGVSWPRSGHHMLARLLKIYFGPEFHHCEFYSPHIECCRKFPCERQDRVHFTKNHDWEFDLPELTDRKYLIQYRSFVPSVVSNFELAVRNGAEDSEKSFRKFASIEFGRYRRFVDKWVNSRAKARRLVSAYEDLVGAPEAELAKIVAFFDDLNPVDPERVRAAVQSVASERISAEAVEKREGEGVHGQRDVRAFRFYDPETFERLDSLHLTRDEVDGAFLRLLDRRPREESYLGHQTQPSVRALERSIMTSAEYRQKTTLWARLLRGLRLG